VTGASGLLGLNLSLVAAAQGHRVTGQVHSHKLRNVPFDVQQIDLQNTDQALSAFQETRPEAIIHCAALANIDQAESSPELALHLNGEVPGILAAAAHRWGIPFIHISTDAVFDGTQSSYSETDSVNPLSEYARSKLVGEQAVQAAYPGAVIARVVFFGWSLSGRRSLSEFFYHKLLAGESLSGFTDAQFCPLYAEDLARLLLEILAADLGGLYHVVSPQHLSKYAFGVRIARRFGFNPDLIQPTRMMDLERRAPRALNLVLKPDKLENALGHSLPSIEEGVDRFYQRWEEEYPQRIQSLAA
jgi:dTDP-4-dehydrorhamnose reductase